MTKYVLKRLLHGLFAIIVVVGIIMVLIYTLLNRDLIFAKDLTWQKQANNAKVTYSYRKWQEYGYVDYVTFQDYVNKLAKNGEIDEETRAGISLGRKAEKDDELTAEYV